jgi:hypothetical protein
LDWTPATRHSTSEPDDTHPADDKRSYFHATALHLLDLDHKKLTYYHNGSQRRLTDVHGEVIRAVGG